MEPQTLVNFLGGIVCTGLGWWLKTLHDMHRSLSEEVKTLAVALPTHYVMKSDLQRLEGVLLDRFDRLEEKLDHKVDKP